MTRQENALLSLIDRMIPGLKRAILRDSDMRPEALGLEIVLLASVLQIRKEFRPIQVGLRSLLSSLGIPAQHPGKPQQTPAIQGYERRLLRTTCTSEVLPPHQTPRERVEKLLVRLGCEPEVGIADTAHYPLPPDTGESMAPPPFPTRMSHGTPLA
jgi:hypothetical protein